MAEERKFRSPRRPPPLPSHADQVTTDEIRMGAEGDESGEVSEVTAAENPIEKELRRRGLKDVEPGTASQDSREPDARAAAVEDLSESDGALVFDGNAPAQEAGPTFVGTLPATPLGEKTEILNASGAGEQEQVPILNVATSAGTSDVEVVRDQFVIGRAPDCEVVVPDQLVSRRHAAVERRNDGWYIVDLDSGNGTFLNEARIKEALLTDGDVIRVGEATITYSGPGQRVEPSVPLAQTTMIPAISGGTGIHATGTVATKKRKRLLLIFGIVVVLLAAVGIAKKLLTPPPATGPTPAQLAKIEQQKVEEEATQTFNKVRELVKPGQEHWAEAKPLILQVEEVYPEDPRVKEYKESILKEAAATQSLLDAKTKVATDDFEGAIAELVKIPSDSSLSQQAEELKKQCEEKQKTKKIELIKQELESKKFQDALALADQLLQADPNNDLVGELKRKAELGLNKPPTRPVGPQNPTPPPPPPRSSTLLQGASLAAYRDGNIDQALSQAESSGVSADGTAELKKLQSMFQHGKELSSNPGQATQAEKFLSDAMVSDKKLGGGQGKISEDLRNVLAKVYFLKGVDAHTRKNYPEAFKAYTQALKVKPDLKTAQDRMKELEGEAKNLFEAAYVFKSTQAEKAVSNCKTVLGMVKPDNPYHAKCKKLLREIQGDEGGSNPPEEGGGF